MAKRKIKSKKKNEEVLVDLVEVVEETGEVLEKYQKWILGGVTALVLLIGGYLAWKNFIVKPKEQEAIQQMWKAEAQFLKDSFDLAITNPGGGYPGFYDIAKQYNGTSAENAANLYAAISHMKLGQFDAALSYLKDFKAKGEIMPIIKYGLMGDAYSEKNDMDQATKYYKKAIKAGDNEAVTPIYMQRLGMLYESRGDYAKALEMYKTLKEKYPETLPAREIDKYILRAEKMAMEK